MAERSNTYESGVHNHKSDNNAYELRVIVYATSGVALKRKRTSANWFAKLTKRFFCAKKNVYFKAMNTHYLL